MHDERLVLVEDGTGRQDGARVIARYGGFAHVGVAVEVGVCVPSSLAEMGIGDVSGCSDTGERRDALEMKASGLGRLEIRD